MGLIYMLTSPSNKRYVGQTVTTVAKRVKQHCQPSSGCKAIRDAIKKYKIENFKIETIIQCNNSELNDYEIHFIAHYDTFGKNGYNLTKGGDGNKGYKHTEESKRKISEAQKGKYIGEKNHFYGKHHSEETRKKISEKHKGKILTEEHKRKLSEAGKGRKHSEESKKLMSEAQKGRKHTEETKRKLSEARRKSYKITYYNSDKEPLIVHNLKKFAKDNGMSYSSLKVYALKGKPYKKFGILKIYKI
jgi:group I intron endonuclease